MTFVKKTLSLDEYGEVLFQHDWMRGEGVITWNCAI